MFIYVHKPILNSIKGIGEQFQSLRGAMGGRATT